MADTLTGQFYVQSGTLMVRFKTPKGKESNVSPGAGQVAAELLPPAGFKGNRDPVDVELDFEGGKPLRIRPVGAAWQSPMPTASAAARPSAGPGGARAGGPPSGPGARPGAPRSAGDRGPGAPAGGRAGAGGAPRRGAAQPAPRQALPSDFHNPYNFVPAPDRRPLTGPLADGPPAGHDRYGADLWTGRLSIRLTMRTPLLVPDAEPVPAEKLKARPPQEHKVFSTRRDPANPQLALLPPTSIKGMLRSAYEAATNSRFGIFGDEWRRPLVRRLPAKDGLGFVPARVEGGQIHLMLGSIEELPIRTGDGWRLPDGGLVYAAALRMYGHNGELLDDPSEVPFFPRPPGHDGDLAHRRPVTCVLQRVRHWDCQEQGRDSGRFSWNAGYDYWAVSSLRPGHHPLPLDPESLPIGPDPEQVEARHRARHHQVLDVRPIAVHGWLCRTNRNMSGKHDERVFFHLPDGVEVHDQDGHPSTIDRRGLRLAFPLDGTLPDGQHFTDAWRALVANYQDLHRAAIRAGRTKPDALRDGSQFSRHIWTGDGHDEERERALGEGDLLYVRVEDGRITGLSPVIIGREFFGTEPWALADAADLLPATDPQRLSPADRVFGWVHPQAGSRAATDQPVAHRGQIAIGKVDTSRAPIEDLTGDDPLGVALAILGQPKPQQALFYAATDLEGHAPAAETSPDTLYRPGQGLRGRKIYPHHRAVAGSADYWAAPADPARAARPDAAGRWREYRRPAEQAAAQRGAPQRGQRQRVQERDDQNRSYLDWIAIGGEMTVDIQVSNLSAAELGALLWLLRRPEGQCHRLGNGKPLGFGSVHIRLTGADLWSGVAIRQRYADAFSGTGGATDGRILLTEGADDTALSPLADAFAEALRAAYGSERPPFLSALERALEGFEDGLPVHYPRIRAEGETGPPRPMSESFEWFVQNLRRDPATGRPRLLPLPGLTEDRGLPAYTAYKGGRRG